MISIILNLLDILKEKSVFNGLKDINTLDVLKMGALMYQIHMKLEDVLLFGLGLV